MIDQEWRKHLRILAFFCQYPVIIQCKESVSACFLTTLLSPSPTSRGGFRLIALLIKNQSHRMLMVSAVGIVFISRKAMPASGCYRRLHLGLTV